MIDSSLIGSCRHQQYFKRYYPPRLHSLKEISFFLDNLQMLRIFFNSGLDNMSVLREIMNVISGDSCHKIVIDETRNFFENLSEFFSSKSFFIEVSTLNYFINQNTIASEWYQATYNAISSDYFRLVTMDKFQIIQELLKIRLLLKSLSNSDCTIHLITHIDLPVSENDLRHLKKRFILTKTIKQALNELGDENIKLVPIWDNFHEKKLTLSSIMKEPKFDNFIGNSTHFSETGLKLVEQFMHIYFEENCN